MIELNLNQGHLTGVETDSIREERRENRHGEWMGRKGRLHVQQTGKCVMP